MSNIDIGQSSAFSPAVLFFKGRYHMVFAAHNDSRALLHAVSINGKDNWSRLNNLRQSTNSAPALFENDGKLVCVFTANNGSNSLLSSYWDEADDVWTDNVGLGESSSTGPVLARNGSAPPFMYWVASNGSNDILVASI